MKDQNAHIFHFDGASKHNPGVVGARWVLTNPKGTIVFSYAWNLGLASNNQVEAYVLLQGVNLASSIRIQNLS
jgi:ribonuclease HI